jgi:hypothetical protein
MTQIERCNWAEKRAANAAYLLNHMLSFLLFFFFLTQTKFARIILSWRHATDPRAFRGSAELFQNLCGALSGREEYDSQCRLPKYFFATA